MDNEGNGALFALNVAKAFESMERPYLPGVLKTFVFGQMLIQWVQLMYTHAKACVSF